MKTNNDIKLDHIAIPATDARKSAKLLAEILGVDTFTDGHPDDPFYCIVFSGAQVMFTERTEKIDLVHFAFRVSEQKFSEVVANLKRIGIAYGNDHENPTNFEISDFLGGIGRVYFYMPDGHLLEVCA